MSTSTPTTTDAPKPAPAPRPRRPRPQVMSVTPALRKVVPKEYLRPVLDAISTRYRKIVGVLMALILMTGGINLHFISQMMLSQTGSGISNSPKYLTILFIKLTLVLGIVTLFLYTFIFKSEPATEGTEEELEAVPFQRIAFWMGILIILCAAAMKYLHF